jgi:CheY-like chemotaxis protein
MLAEGSRGGQASAVLRGPLALVVDDSDDTREMCAVLLVLEGFTVEEARDGREGLRKAGECSPDIIITDLAMPHMDGWEMMQRLKAGECTRRIPIIACSGDETQRGRRHLAADVILSKPCSLDLLLMEVRRLLLGRAA